MVLAVILLTITAILPKSIAEEAGAKFNDKSKECTPWRIDEGKLLSGEDAIAQRMNFGTERVVPLWRLSRADRVLLKSQRHNEQQRPEQKIALLDLIVESTSIRSNGTERQEILDICADMLEPIGYKIVCDSSNLKETEDSTRPGDIRVSISVALRSKDQKDGTTTTTAKWSLRCLDSSNHETSVARSDQYVSKGGGGDGRQRFEVRLDDGNRMVYTRPALCPRQPPQYEPALAMNAGGFVIQFAKDVAQCAAVPERAVLLAAMGSAAESRRDRVSFVQAQAAWQLVKLGDPNYIQPMYECDLENVSDESAATRLGRDAVTTQLGEKAISALITMMVDADSPYNPGTCPPIVGPGATISIKNPPERILLRMGRVSVPFLTDVLKRQDVGYAKLRAVWTLGEIKDRRAIQPLIDAFADAPTPLKEKIIYALSRIGGTRAMDALRHIAKHDQNAVARDVAASVLKSHRKN